MPLLRKQPFHKVKPLSNLDPEDEVFLCKITNEIFKDYEEFFERIILCNSLVWSCAITGRSGMTYQEAEDCEEKARRQLATFPESLQRPLLILSTMTYRGRLVDLNDDVFLFAKDRYFIGENVDVLIAGERRPSKIIKVVAPAENTSKSNGDVIVIDEDSESDGDEKKELPASEKIMYIVHPSTGKNNRVMVKASQVTRKKGLYTRDKSKLFLKQHCEPINGVWSVKESVMRKLHLTEARYEDFFSGPKPHFGRSDIKKKNVGKKPIEKTPTPSTSTTPKITTSTPPSTTNSKNSSPAESVASPLSTLTPAERAALKEKERQEKIAERMAKQEEMKRKIDEERQRKKEERDKEREKKKQEKKQQMEKLKEWSRPREDMECEDLKPLPEFKEVNCRVPSFLFGDAVMVLEYLSAFKTIFDFKQFFPKGLSWTMLESALMDCDPQGSLCDLLQMLLCALFNLQEEEAEEYMELEKEEKDEVEKAKPMGEDDQPMEDEDHVSNNELIRSATAFAQFSQVTFGLALRDTLLDQFTLTEVLRLHLMSSGARANSKNARFRYQQRGGYYSLDDPGLELRKQDPQLLKKLQTGNIFDLSPEEKLRLVSTLVQQVMTYAAVRDIVEDSYDKLRVKKYDFKLLQWAEVRRIREDQVASYKRQMDIKNKEREYRLKEYSRNEQIKQAKEQGLDPPNLPPLENPPETPEGRKKREEKEQQEESKKRADYFKKELESLQQIADLQRTNALYPMGRDRFYRRYWLFSSLPAVAVEDHELFLCPASLPLVDESIQAESDKTRMPTLTKQEDHNTSSDKENELSAHLTSSETSDTPVRASGVKDREDDCVVISDDESQNKEGKKSVDAETGEDRLLSDSASNNEKEALKVGVNENDTVDKKVTEDSDIRVCVDGGAQVNTMDTESKSPPASVDPPKLESLPAEIEQFFQQHQGDNQAARWYIIDSKDCFKDLLEVLNVRGFRENALSAVLADFKPLLEVTIDSCASDFLCLPSEGEEGAAAKMLAHTRTSAPKIVEGSTKSDSASEAIELTLRDALLDLEERIFVGSLGAMKVKDRFIWRAALESGSYSPQTAEAPFIQVKTPQKYGRNGSDGEVHIPEEIVARDLAYALVQIARGVEPRFMTQPLGDDDKRKGFKEETPDKEVRRRSTFDRWEESALQCSSLSQVFLHLAAFDKSIKWDRSALLARCRICRRKGDAEKMLLCDKCDRGHHMYCLKPPMTKVPTGDWFCPNCHPKLPAASPRKSRRRTFSEVEDEEEEEAMELQDTINETNEEEDEQQSEEDAVEEEEEDSDSEEEVENEDVCAECREDGKLILCDVCPRSYHMHCAKPPLKKVPKGKWMCQVCVGGGRAGKIQFSRPTKPTTIKLKETPTASKKEVPKVQGSGGGSSKSGKLCSRPVSHKETPRNSLTPTSSRIPNKKDSSTSRDVTPKSAGQRVTPKSSRDKDSTPKSWDQGKLKRSSSSSSRLSADGGAEFEINARQYTSSKRGNTQVQQMKLAQDLLQELIRHADAWPFLKPVDKKLVPDYYNVIVNPMDLSTIRNKVHNFQYSTPCQLLDDVRLIFANCIEYNARNTPEYRAGQGLCKFFQGREKDLGLQEEASSPSALSAKKQKR